MNRNSITYQLKHQLVIKLLTTDVSLDTEVRFEYMTKLLHRYRLIPDSCTAAYPR